MQTELENTVMTFNPNNSKLVRIGGQKYYTSINFSHLNGDNFGYAVYYMRTVHFNESAQFQEEHIYKITAKIAGLSDCKESALYFICMHIDLQKGDEKTALDIGNTDYLFQTITS
jgi:hypothetical protein|tara:strand:+ start:819 stop:1163 length:345 start_codon:yes stop_codon:yes gene_type:complete